MQRIHFLFTIFLMILYGFVASAQPVSESVTPPAPKPTIAVTTFENLSAFPENDWVGAGFAESLTTKLAKLENIDIIERRQLNRVLKANGLEQKEISETHWEKAETVGKTLFNLRGVEYLLIGSVQMTGKYDDLDAKLSVNARTVKVETAEITKGEAKGLSGKVADLFELQTQLAEWFV